MATLSGKQSDEPVVEAPVEAPVAVAEAPVAVAEVPVAEAPVAEAPVVDSSVLEAPLFSTGFEKEAPALSEEEQAKQELLEASGNTPAPTVAQPPPTTEEAKAKAELLAASGHINVRSGLAIINAGIADLLDLAPDTIIAISNALISGVGLDKVIGLAPQGSFRRLLEATGSTFPEEVLPQGILAEGLRFLGQSFGGLPILGRLLMCVCLFC